MKAGEGKKGTDVHEVIKFFLIKFQLFFLLCFVLIIYKFIRIFCSRSFAQLNATFDIYGEQNNKNDIEKAIKKEMSGKLERAFLAIVKSIRNKPEYFAELLHEAMKGMCYINIF